MNNLVISRPEKPEYDPYYDMYISLVEGADILSALDSQIDKTLRLLNDISDEKGLYRYEEGKWSIKELVGHVIDTERVMAYRALRIGRGDKTPNQGFDQDPYIANSDFDSCEMRDLSEEFRLVRRANIMMFGNLTKEAWLRTGTASDRTFSTRGLAYVIGGHELHHMKILRERYLD